MKILIFSLLLVAPVWAQENCPIPVVTPFMDEEIEVLSDQLGPQEELIKVEKVEYKRNANAEFCKRPTEMVDTIVIHHSETTSLDTALDINRYHLDRGTATDPWLMIAYGFVINSPYAGGRIPLPKVTEGRPMDIVSASQGSNAWVTLTEDQKKLWDDGKITCGKEGGTWAKKDALVVNGKIKANVTTVGLVVNGNYTLKSAKNPNGYVKGKTRNPTKDTQLMIAKLACQLQRQYPTIKYIKWHSYYHATSCPGTIKNFIGNIKTLAKQYSCDFQ